MKVIKQEDCNFLSRQWLWWHMELMEEGGQSCRPRLLTQWCWDVSLAVQWEGLKWHFRVWFQMLSKWYLKENSNHQQHSMEFPNL
jgi:hypothetical protein